MTADEDTERAPRASRTRRAMVLCASVTGSSMAFVNGTAVNLAIDPIQEGLRAGLGSMLWVASIYMLFLSAMMLIGGAIGDFYGRRATFVTGVAVFMLTSIGCAMAPNVEVLIAMRAGQGLGAALLTPMSLTLIADFFPGRGRSAAIGTWSAASALFTAIGPPLGGFLAENEGWRTIFLMPLPLGLLALGFGLFGVPKRPPPRTPEKIDWQGALAATVGFGAIAYGLISLSERPGLENAAFWAAPLLIGALALFALVHIERRAPSPMVPPSLFAIGTFNAINLITILLYGALGGIFLFYPIYLTDAYGHGVDEIGLAFLGFAVPMLALTAFSGKLTRRFGVRAMLTAGSLVGIAAFGSMGLLPWSGSLWGAFGSMAIFGAGIALVVPGANTALFNVTPDQSHGAASAVNNACARAATLFAIAGYGAAASWGYRQVAGPDARLVGYGGGDALTGAAGANYRAAIEASFELLTVVSMGLALLSALVAAFFISGPVGRTVRKGPPGRSGVRRVYGTGADEAPYDGEGAKDGRLAGDEDEEAEAHADEAEQRS